MRNGDHSYEHHPKELCREVTAVRRRGFAASDHLRHQRFGTARRSVRETLSTGPEHADPEIEVAVSELVTNAIGARRGRSGWPPFGSCSRSDLIARSVAGPVIEVTV